MRVMAWNVWGRFGGNWREREESILTTLATYRPDVLGLVESWSGEGTDQPRRSRHRTACTRPGRRFLPPVHRGGGAASRWVWVC